MPLCSRKRALTGLTIAVFACLFTPHAGFAKDDSPADPYFCLHADLCVFNTPLSPLGNVEFDGDLGSVSVRLSTGGPVYFIKVVPLHSGKRAKAYWNDLFKTLRRQSELTDLRVTESGHYALDDTGEALYRLVEYEEGASAQKVLYHLLQIEDRDFWVIVTSTDTEGLRHYNSEIISLLKSARLGNAKSG